MSTPASRPVHPCILSLSEGTRGAEFSCWAHVTTARRDNNNGVPNLVIGAASTLSVYTVDPSSGTLLLEHFFGNLNGSLAFLGTLRSSSDDTPDALLAGFCGDARLTVLRVTEDSVLRAESLLDLTSVVTQHNCGAFIGEHDIQVALTTPPDRPGRATVACILGGGVAVAVLEVSHVKQVDAWVVAIEPYVVPLQSLALSSLPHVTAAPQQQMISTGFGDMYSLIFMPGFLEPVLVLLHSRPGGRAATCRLGREKGVEGGATPLFVTALSVSVAHRRTALLWCRPVTADALYLSTVGKTLVSVGANTFVCMNAMGNLEQVLAVNGWAHSTCPDSLMSSLAANPLIKLAVQLDGSCLASLSDSTALLALRAGQLYVFQRSAEVWSLLPLGQTLGAVGEVALLTALAFQDDKVASFAGSKMMYQKNGESSPEISMGLVLAGSRLGDSLLLGYALESVNVSMDAIARIKHDPVKEESTPLVKLEESADDDILQNGGTSGMVDEEYDRILRLEEDALYGPTVATQAGPDVVPPSDGEEENAQHDRKRQRIAKITMIRALTPLDTLVNPGPLGPSCEGPISQVPAFLADREDPTATNASDSLFGATAFIFPSGHGSSGGLSIVTAPGRDDRTIVAEEDCVDVRCMFSLPMAGYVLLGMSPRVGNGISVLRVDASGSASSKMVITEIDLSTLYSAVVETSGVFGTTADVLSATLLSAGEFSSGHFALCVKTLVDGDLEFYSIVVFNKDFRMVSQATLDSGGGTLVRITPFLRYEQSNGPAITFGCLWSSGTATVAICSTDGDIQSFTASRKERSRVDSTDDEDEEVKRLREFYADESIVAVDVFKAPKYVFESSLRESSSIDRAGVREHPQKIDDQSNEAAREPLKRTDWSRLTVAKLKAELKKRGLQAPGKKTDLVNLLEESDRRKEDSEQQNLAGGPPSPEVTPMRPPVECFSDQEGQVLSVDEEEQLLYSRSRPPDTSQATTALLDQAATDLVDYVAVCRQSGQLEVYALDNDGLHWRWTAAGCGHGSVVLGGTDNESKRTPVSQAVCVNEMRFFSCGPADSKSQGKLSVQPCFCLILETTSGDLTIYKAVRRTRVYETLKFLRVPMRSVVRPSKEQSRHHTKLMRKRIVGNTTDQDDSFVVNSLHRFNGISGQDGLFAAGAMPRWIVCERGRPTWLLHRTRHASPAGVTERPIRAFCSGLQPAGNNGCFMTLHERVGRVGSQRLTLFESISKAFGSRGLFPGAGLCLETFSLGVTVRKIQFIDDENVSTGSNPLYALLVSRELEIDQREWNSDGLSPEERAAIEDEKEKAIIRKQVEADLGGFDLQSDWVEEIERENCFDIDTELGGAPPINKSSYSLWIVDAGNSWAVVDSYELEEYVHGITMQAMSLTEFKAEPGRSGAMEVDDDIDEVKVPFIAVGTGTVDHNGEDLTCKGRTLLFRLTRSRSAGRPVVELSLAYEKDIFHGPVTSLSCLSVDGKNRLVIGAGPDVNIEQWGNNRLTQVGFFRATMHILDIIHFKNFLLLSDAYDSLYFLVWRESDKSLTLLAKDYDPNPVYAAGLMSRGAAMTFLCHDDRQNLQFFQYAPGEAAARGGNKLVCQADCHLGTQTTAFFTHFCRSSLLVHTATPTSSLAALKQQDSYYGRSDDDQRLGVFFGTTDGGIGSVIPLSEPVFWRLTALQSVLANALETNCALSQRAWRLYRRTPRRGGCRSNDRKKSVIDGDLLLQYADLPTADQEDLAASIGSTVDMILDNLLEVQCSSYMI